MSGFVVDLLTTGLSLAEWDFLAACELVEVSFVAVAVAVAVAAVATGAMLSSSFSSGRLLL